MLKVSERDIFPKQGDKLMAISNDYIQGRFDAKIIDMLKEMSILDFFEMIDEHIKAKIVKGDYDDAVNARILKRKGHSVIA